MKKILLAITIILTTQSAHTANYIVNVETDSFFSDANCDKNVHSEQLKEFFDVCNSFNIKLTEENNYNVDYRLVTKPKNHTWSTHSFVSEIKFEEGKFFTEETFELNTTYNDYAIQACDQSLSCELINLNEANCTVNECEVVNTITINKANLPSSCTN